MEIPYIAIVCSSCECEYRIIGESWASFRGLSHDNVGCIQGVTSWSSLQPSLALSLEPRLAQLQLTLLGSPAAGILSPGGDVDSASVPGQAHPLPLPGLPGHHPAPPGAGQCCQEAASQPTTPEDTQGQQTQTRKCWEIQTVLYWGHREEGAKKVTFYFHTKSTRNEFLYLATLRNLN